MYSVHDVISHTIAEDFMHVMSYWSQLVSLCQNKLYNCLYNIAVTVRLQLMNVRYIIHQPISHQQETSPINNTL